MTTQPPSITLRAPAKINLTLAITGRRDDGYHLMQSLVVFADLADDVTVTPIVAEADVLTIHGNAALAAQPDNIMLAAVEAYRKATGTAQRFHLTLTKSIPMAAGVGGGSADAAATLLAVNAHHGDMLDDDALAALGLTLGADVPVCLAGHRHLIWRMEGIGEELTAVDFPAARTLGMILTNPGVEVPTAAVFQALQPHDFRAPRGGADHLSGLDALGEELALGNSLTRPAEAREGAIAAHLDALATLARRDGYLSHGMSGSGATCFALFTSPAAAAAAATHLPGTLHWCWAGGLYTPPA